MPSTLAKKVLSKDGTAIAFDRIGHGSPVILVDGALCYRAMGPSAALAKLLARHFTVIIYDRRGRGDSGDTAPYAVEREVDDIEALVNVAGGAAFVWGVSSGAVLALEATNRLPGIKKLALYEAPFIVDDSRPPLSKDWARNRRGGRGRPPKRCGSALPEGGWGSRGLRRPDAIDACMAEAQSRCAHAPLRRRDRAGQPERQAAVGQPVGFCHDTDARHGRWEEPCVDPPRDAVARSCSAERAVPHARRTDAHGKGEGARSGVGGVLQMRASRRRNGNVRDNIDDCVVAVRHQSRHRVRRGSVRTPNRRVQLDQFVAGIRRPLECRSCAPR
jgi:pimeloyl-ACP methyl ester carboxylesterase